MIIRSVLGTEGFNLQGFDPIDCLAAAKTLADCAVYPPLERPAVDSAYTVLDTERDDVATLDLNPIICPDLPVCAPVIGRTIVWKDPDHVTSTFLVERRDQIWSRLLDTDLLDPTTAEPLRRCGCTPPAAARRRRGAPPAPPTRSCSGRAASGTAPRAIPAPPRRRSGRRRRG